MEVSASKYVADSEIMTNFHIISYHDCFKGTARGRELDHLLYFLLVRLRKKAN